MDDFGVAEEPEEMLVKDRVAAAGRVVEGRAEVTVGEQHGDGAGEHRQGQQQQERRDELRPDEERHAVQRHAGGAHVEDRGDEVDGAEDRPAPAVCSARMPKSTAGPGCPRVEKGA